jgi:hypothetical protein
MENENQKQLQIELKPDVATGVYSNLAVVANTPSEFVMDFIAMLPGLPKAEVRSRVIMTPEHAKRLLYALQERVNGYERQFGTIDLHQPDPKGRTIAPFGTGEA